MVKVVFGLFFGFCIGVISATWIEIQNEALASIEHEVVVAELRARPDAKVLSSVDIDFAAARSMFGDPLKRDAKPPQKLVAQAVLIQVHPSEGRVLHPYEYACIKVDKYNGEWRGFVNGRFQDLGFTKTFVAKETSLRPRFP